MKTKLVLAAALIASSINAFAGNLIAEESGSSAEVPKNYIVTFGLPGELERSLLLTSRVLEKGFLKEESENYSFKISAQMSSPGQMYVHVEGFVDSTIQEKFCMTSQVCLEPGKVMHTEVSNAFVLREGVPFEMLMTENYTLTAKLETK